MKGRFIVLEGPDGSGTTTHAQRLAERLTAQGKDVFLTHEPTDGPIGKTIRQMLSSGELPSSALQLMFCADRAWHVENEILPALEAGKTVISDRYALSTIVYGEALGLDAEWMKSVNTKFVQPDIQLVLLPPFETCLERLGERKSRDIMEEDSLQKRVYDGYTKRASDNAMTVIDTSGSIDGAAEEILRSVSAD